MILRIRRGLPALGTAGGIHITIEGGDFKENREAGSATPLVLSPILQGPSSAANEDAVENDLH
ncbi:MAG: hypothetical protein K8F58_12125, partial [Bauldia sp.]|nr:hypothetical protein [Bauldia sp.]